MDKKPMKVMNRKTIINNLVSDLKNSLTSKIGNSLLSVSLFGSTSLGKIKPDYQGVDVYLVFKGTNLNLDVLKKVKEILNQISEKYSGKEVFVYWRGRVGPVETRIEKKFNILIHLCPTTELFFDMECFGNPTTIDNYLKSNKTLIGKSMDEIVLKQNSTFHTILCELDGISQQLRNFYILLFDINLEDNLKDFFQAASYFVSSAAIQFIRLFGIVENNREKASKLFAKYAANFKYKSLPLEIVLKKKKITTLKDQEIKSYIKKSLAFLEYLIDYIIKMEDER